jgi:hypothetical protein
MQWIACAGDWGGIASAGRAAIKHARQVFG